MPKICPHSLLYLRIKRGDIKVHLRSPIEHRFWSRVSKEGQIHPTLGTRCWEWTHSKDKDGYGLIWMEGKVQRSNRVCWIIHNGFIGKGLWVLHKCDNPGCVNPSHLWLGTYKDNIADMIFKERQASGNRHSSVTHPERMARGKQHGRYTKPDKSARGDRHGMSKLTGKDVLQIRKLYSLGGITQIKLAARFNVSRRTVWCVINKKTWNCIKET